MPETINWYPECVNAPFSGSSHLLALRDHIDSNTGLKEGMMWDVGITQQVGVMDFSKIRSLYAVIPVMLTI